MRRFKTGKNDKRNFSKTSRPHPANTIKSVMRGGIRK